MNESLKILLAYLLIVLIALLAASCTNQRKVATWMDDNKGTAAALCAERFPVEERTDTAWIVDSAKLAQYESEYQTLTTYINELLNEGCDTVTVERVMERIKAIPCKPQPQKVITRTVENTARIVSQRDTIVKLEAKVANLNGKLANRTKQRNRLFYIIIALSLWLLRKPIARLIGL